MAIPNPSISRLTSVLMIFSSHILFVLIRCASDRFWNAHPLSVLVKLRRWLLLCVFYAYQQPTILQGKLFVLTEALHVMAFTIRSTKNNAASSKRYICSVDVYTNLISRDSLKVNKSYWLSSQDSLLLFSMKSFWSFCERNSKDFMYVYM